jgi:hypothetical protein
MPEPIKIQTRKASDPLTDLDKPIVRRVDNDYLCPVCAMSMSYHAQVGFGIYKARSGMVQVTLRELCDGTWVDEYPRHIPAWME